MNFDARFLAVACGLAFMSAGPLHAQSVTEFAPPSENLTKLQGRVAELERLLQQATDQTERAQVEARRLRTENERLQRLLDDALQQAKAREPVGAPFGDPGPSSPPQSVAAAPTAKPSAPQSSSSMGTLAAAEAPGDAAQAFRIAQKLVQESRFAEAEVALSNFVRAYPDSADAAEGRYWLGRTQIVRGRHNDAAQTFVELLRVNPTSPRAPDAWVRIGVALRNMSQTAQACQTFKDFFENYPEANAATKQFAADQARITGCPATGR